MPNPGGPSEPPIGQVIVPGTTPVEAPDVEAVVRATIAVLAETPPAKSTPAAQLANRVDQHIKELQQSKRKLGEELDRVRYEELTHLRNDQRWLENRLSATRSASDNLRTSYDWVIGFNWFSFALIAIGVGLVSFAAFLPDSLPGIGPPKLVAAFAFAALVIGVIVQAMISFRGSRAIFWCRRLVQDGGSAITQSLGTEGSGLPRQNYDLPHRDILTTLTGRGWHRAAASSTLAERVVSRLVISRRISDVSPMARARRHPFGRDRGGGGDQAECGRDRGRMIWGGLTWVVT